ncbi:MAG: hypothetical protein MUC48_00280 [Leptolyngbya sp. Prado105]|jgi:hypothetical protein|nr:hypothetical protein [Leptolyngbya sp. Prado105]
MTYRDSLFPWCIIRLLPKMQRIVVCRCRNRNQAQAHIQALQRLNRQAIYEVIFDPMD